MITNIELVKYMEALLNQPTEYWYGTWGNKATKSLLAQKRKQYPKYYDESAYKKPWTCDGRRVVDCCGAIKGAMWSGADINKNPQYVIEEDLSANGMYEKGSTEKGPISTLPEIPGVILWKNGHVAVYIGQNKCIEAKGHDSGVVVSLVNERPFTNWFKCKFIKYPESKRTINVTAIVDGVTYNGNIEEV